MKTMNPIIQSTQNNTKYPWCKEGETHDLTARGPVGKKNKVLFDI